MLSIYSGRDVLVLNESLRSGRSLGGLNGNVSDGGKDNGGESSDHTGVGVIIRDDSGGSKIGGLGSGSVNLLGLIVVGRVPVGVVSVTVGVVIGSVYPCVSV